MVLGAICKRNFASVLLASGLCPPPAFAQSESDFFRGKTVTISVGFGPGGGYDRHARTLARHMGKHLPGNPSIVVKNVPGAAGLVLANTLFQHRAEGWHGVRHVQPHRAARSAARQSTGTLRRAAVHLAGLDGRTRSIHASPGILLPPKALRNCASTNSWWQAPGRMPMPSFIPSF